jgi:hypothetical protein
VEKILVFGASGAIGGAIAATASERGWEVVATSRRLRSVVDDPVQWISVDPFAQDFTADELKRNGPYSAVCWAQGSNGSDNVFDVDLDANMEMYRSNCLFILATLKVLLQHQMLAPGSRLCVLSSIWQQRARQNKLSYCMTKAALQGLVLSAATDLASDGHLINAVLPGALDTPMTHANLSNVQLQRLVSATGFQRLASLNDVASLVLYLCSRENGGVTGQFITSDMGFSNVRLI